MHGKKERGFLLKIIWQSSKERYFWMIFFVLLSVIPKFINVYGIKIIIDLITRQASFADIVFAILFLVIGESVYYLFGGLYNNIIIPKSDIKIKKFLNDKMFLKLSSCDLQCFDDSEFYETVTLGIKDADKTVIDYFLSLQNFLINITGLIFIGAMIAAIDAIVLLAPLAAVAVTLALNFFVTKLTYRFSNEKIKAERYSEFLKRIFYSPAYAKEIIVLPFKALLFKEYDKTNQTLLDINAKYSKKLTALRIVSDICFSLLAFGLIMCIVSYRVIYRQLSIGDFAALTNASLSSVNSFMTVALTLPELNKYKLYSKNITSLLNYENRIFSPAHPLSFGGDYFIEFKNVTFSYPFTPQNTVLNDVSFTVEPNSKLAIVGFNGSGKTTLINLLLRLYDVSSGEITYGGNNIKEYSLSELRGKFNILFQDFQKYPLSVCETVLMRAPNSDSDIELVWNTLEKVGLKEKILGSANGLNSKITREFDKEGLVLSGGEMQKLMLARILAQPQPVIILDEPSSALDPMSETSFFDDIIKNIRDKTVIFITHRLNAAKNADKIILLRNGRIIQTGTHRRLISEEGEYKNMYEMQAKRYELDPDEKIII